MHALAKIFYNQTCIFKDLSEMPFKRGLSLRSFFSIYKFYNLKTLLLSMLFKHHGSESFLHKGYGELHLSLYSTQRNMKNEYNNTVAHENPSNDLQVSTRYRHGFLYGVSRPMCLITVG